MSVLKRWTGTDWEQVGVSSPPAGVPVVIAEQTLTSAATFIEFTGIPQTYKHLRIEGRLRSDRATGDGVSFRVGNGSVDTGTNYSYLLIWPGVTVDTNNTSASVIEIGRCPGADSAANLWSYQTIDINDYQTIAYWRTFRGNAMFQGASAFMSNTTGYWKNTANPIDVVRVFPSTGPNFLAGSQLRLMGIPAPFANGAIGGGFVPRAEIRRGTTQSISNATWTLLSFDTEVLDTDSLFVIGSPDRFTIQTSGRYQIGLHCDWQPNTTGLRAVAISRGTTLASGFLAKDYRSPNPATPGHSLVTEADFVAGETVAFQVHQTQGVAQTISAHTDVTTPMRATIRRVSD